MNQIVDSGSNGLIKKLLVGTPTLGSIRMEWASARYGQTIPSNWSKLDMIQYMSSYIPMRYQVADAQNLIVQETISKGYEWLLLLEDDTMPPPDAFLRFTEYMRQDKYPVVSGLYFTRSEPAEPMVYRGRGNSYYTGWKLGDVIEVDGVPTGMLLINVKLLKEVYNDSDEYIVNGTVVRKVFQTPEHSWFNEKTGAIETLVGTSDLDFCTKVIEKGYLKKHWPHLAKKKYPFIIDTNIPCMHIERTTGEQYPLGGIRAWCEERGMV